jgi:hypothetical protein
MNYSLSMYTNVPEVEIDGRRCKILLGPKLNKTDLMTEIQVNYQEINTNNSNYSKFLNYSLSQNNSKLPYIVIPTATPISAKVNDITIFKDQKGNDVALIKGEYRTIHMIPATADNNQTTSLYDKFKTLKWNQERRDENLKNGDRDDTNKPGHQIIFDYANGQLTLSTQSQFSLVINGIPVDSADIEKGFKEVSFGKTFDSGTYGAFCQQFIKEKGFFACDEIFTEEQTKAIVAKGIIDKVADKKKIINSAEAIANRTGGNATVTAQATTFDVWRNQTLNNLDAIMSSPFKPLILLPFDDNQVINTACTQGLSDKRSLLLDRSNPRYQDEGFPLVLREAHRNFERGSGKAQQNLRGGGRNLEYEQDFQQVGKDGKHNGNHNGFLQGGEDDEATVGEDDEATVIESKNKKQLEKQRKGIGGRN